MSALGGSGRAAPRRKSGFDPKRTPKSSDSVCEITIRAGQTDPGSSGIDLSQRDRPLLLKLCSAAPEAVALSLVSNSSLVEGTP
jgi:hypothetical protein